jgi:hypothetical protein
VYNFKIRDTKKMKKKHKQKNRKQEYFSDEYNNTQNFTEKPTKKLVLFGVGFILFTGLVLFALQQKKDTSLPPSFDMTSLLATGTPYIGMSSTTQKEVATSTEDLFKNSSTGTPKLSQKKATPKVLKGQEALDFIKTLPLETQKQIMEGQKKP